MYTAIYRNARRAALFFLFCLLTALVGLPLRGALATPASHGAPAAAAHEEQVARPVLPVLAVNSRTAAPAATASAQGAAAVETLSAR